MKRKIAAILELSVSMIAACHGRLKQALVLGRRDDGVMIAVGLIGGVVAAHELGFWLGSLDRSADDLSTDR